MAVGKRCFMNLEDLCSRLMILKASQTGVKLAALGRFLSYLAVVGYGVHAHWWDTTYQISGRSAENGDNASRAKGDRKKLAKAIE